MSTSLVGEKNYIRKSFGPPNDTKKKESKYFKLQSEANLIQFENNIISAESLIIQQKLFGFVSSQSIILFFFPYLHAKTML